MKESTIKSFLLISFLSLAGTFISAQNKILQIYKDGNVTNAIEVSQIDSIKFVDRSDFDQGVVINGTRWATCNVDVPGSFTTSPESVGKYYQWNRSNAWAATGPVADWDSSIPSGSTWEKSNSPCPAGWRLPTKTEIQSLIDSGSTWVVKGGVKGRQFGSGANTIFLPAVGYRHRSDGTITSAGYYGDYWSGTQLDGSHAYILFFASANTILNSDYRNYGLPVRCVADESEPIAVSSISLDKTDLPLNVGESYTLIASVLPVDATDKTVTWMSGNTSVAMVDNYGKVTAMASGATTITAKAGGKTAICSVSVSGSNVPDNGIVINGIKWATCNVDAPGTFAVNPESSGMFYQWDSGIGWSPIDPMTSSPAGHSWDDSQDTSIPQGSTWEKVNDPCPAGWRVPTRTEMESLINAGNTRTAKNGVNGFQLGSGSNVIFLPVTGERFSFDGKLFSSEWSGNYWSGTPNYNIGGAVFSLTFDEKRGARVTGASNQKYGYCVRCVADDYVPVSSISLDKTSLSLKVGTYGELIPTVLPDNATDKAVIWTSSNTSVVTINSNTGSVWAAGKGTAMITAKAGDKTATCSVTVYGTAVLNVSLDKTELTLKVGESYTLLPTIFPADATDKIVAWTSSNPSVASVDATGKVLAAAVGTTTITAKVGGATAFCLVTVGSEGGGGGDITDKTFNSAQLYYYGNMSSNTTYFRLSLFNYPSADNEGLVIEGFCEAAYTFDNFKLDTGTYTFSPTYGVAKTFIEGEIFGDCSVKCNFMGTYYYKPNNYVLVDGGTCTVSLSGNTYTVTTNFKGYSKNSFVENVCFRYSGVPEKIDFFK